MRATFLTTPELLDAKWPQAAPLLDPVVKEAARGEFTMEDLHRMSKEGRVIAAVAEHDGTVCMAMVFEFVHYPQTLAVNILALGGSGLAGVADEFWATFRQWCVQAGATVIEAACSDAMARILRRHGFESTYRIVRSAL